VKVTYGYAVEAFKCPGCGDDVEADDPIGTVDGDWVCLNCVERAG
jgi:hypothetical protein